MRTYSEAMKFDDYYSRLEYLKLNDNNVLSPRHMSNNFYKSPPWLQCREDIIMRDLGNDLGVKDMPIDGVIIVHHINPITEEDIMNWSPKLFDPENLIATSTSTHNNIHYSKKREEYIERQPGDTSPWLVA